MRYFFHTADGTRERDTEGQELADLPTARRQAILFAGECMLDKPELLDDRDFRVEITDERDMLLFTVIMLAVNAPASGSV